MSRMARWKACLRSAAPGLAATYLRLKEWARSVRRGGSYLEGIFAEIYQGNLWGEPESVSGPGSSLVETVAVRRELPSLLAGLGVRTLLDAPCGDCHWILGLPLDLDLYIGADIVPSLVQRNAAELAGAGREFRQLDLTRDPLPRTDAILCRDCLIHFSYRFIEMALDNFRRSGARYLLTTTYSGLPANRDILSGQWRPIDLELPPFHLPPPRHLILEKECDVDGFRLRRSLGIWDLGDMR